MEERRKVKEGEGEEKEEEGERLERVIIVVWTPNFSTTIKL